MIKMQTSFALTIRSACTVLLIMQTTCCFFAQAAHVATDWWNQPYPLHSELDDPRKLPLISVRGTVFVNAAGDTVLFKGLSISDPDKLQKEGMWNRKHFEHIRKTGAMIVRVPVHPIAWRERTPEGYLALLDQCIAWCTELDMYVIIDWHSIGNLGMELFQHPMYNTSKTETYQFWRTIAERYAGNNTVAFYEIFNEPTLYRGQLGTMSWDEWKVINENIIRLIRSYDPETIPLVAGFDWAYDLTMLHTSPIDMEGIAYVTHPYEFKRDEPWEPKWEENFGFAARSFPVFATEFGIYLEEGEVIGPEHYGNRIIAFLEERDISWVSWVYDPKWHPQMLKSWNYDLTPAGEFFAQKMQSQLR
jgi:aryl-phospho-beta-D-glucosidase BglC (GH1 family)